MVATLTYKESHCLSDEAANHNFLSIRNYMQILSKEELFS